MMTNTTANVLLTNCIYETLRIDPSARISLDIRMREKCKLGSLTVLPMTDVHIYIRGLQHNPKEWREPEKFVPERFDPESEWYLTPSGKKRHPMSYGPFLGGHRICLGKTFALNSTNRVLPIILMQLDFEFTDK